MLAQMEASLHGALDLLQFLDVFFLIYHPQVLDDLLYIV